MRLPTITAPVLITPRPATTGLLQGMRWPTACSALGLMIRGVALISAMMATGIHAHEQIAAIEYSRAASRRPIFFFDGEQRLTAHIITKRDQASRDALQRSQRSHVGPHVAEGHRSWWLHRGYVKHDFASFPAASPTTVPQIERDLIALPEVHGAGTERIVRAAGTPTVRRQYSDRGSRRLGVDPAYRWVYDKIAIAKRQGLDAGPYGTAAVSLFPFSNSYA